MFTGFRQDTVAKFTGININDLWNMLSRAQYLQFLTSAVCCDRYSTVNPG